MALAGLRMMREYKTMEIMIGMYCRGNHGMHNGLCAECRELLDYAHVRLEKCPFQEGKTTCARCTVHCYKAVMREKIRTVMRYAGPRMAYAHPILALLHYLDGRRKQPLPTSRKQTR